MGDVPEFGFQQGVGMLGTPGVVHDMEGFFCAGNGEELVLRAVDEEHRLGAGYGGDVWIVEPAAQAGQAVGEAAVLGAAVVERH